jgi:hypothetical protein
MDASDVHDFFMDERAAHQKALLTASAMELLMAGPGVGINDQ